MADKKKDVGTKTVASNKEAYHRYQILEKLEAGIVLTGTEVKSVRNNKLSFNDSFVHIKNTEAFLAHLHIAEYSHGNRANHEPMRERKLLLRHQQILNLMEAIQEDGKTVVPLSIYLKAGLIKVELGIARGKKLHDKRATLKEKDAKREMAKAMKQSSRR